MAILIWGSITLLAVLSWATYQSALLLRRVQIEFNVLLSPVENVVKLLLIGVCLAIGFSSGVSRRQLGWDPGQGLTEVWLGLGLGVGFSLLSTLGTMLAVKVFGPEIYSPAIMKNIVPRSREEWFPVLVAILPAVILEELLFRSFLLGGFSLIIPAIVAALLFSTFFGLMHAPQGILGVVGTGLVGFVLSVVFIWRGSLLAPLVAHYTTNVLQLTTAKWEMAWMDRMDGGEGPDKDDIR